MKNFKETSLAFLENIDQIFVPMVRKLFQEKSSLLLFMFHVIFENEHEMNSHVIAPQQKMTLQNCRQFIEYYLNRGYQFVSPDDITGGLDPYGKYVLLTFDDGYLNNLRLLPLMKEYKVPALFFIASNFIKNQKCFWWDVLYRERKKEGFSEQKIDQENRLLQGMTHEDVDRYLIRAFGEKSLCPVSDLDRPFNPQELRNFSNEKYVFLGNHTRDHAVLTHYSRKEIGSQITGAQNDIYEITGKNPLVFSYPNGDHSSDVVRAVKEAGFRLAVTCDFGKNFLPIAFNGDQSLKMKRFCFSSGRAIKRQAPLFCSDYSLYVTAKRVKHAVSRGGGG